MTERFSSAALGFVCIAGTGMGRLGLMTLRALSRLRNADLGVHDRQVSTEALVQRPPETQRVFGGKAFGIHALLVAHAWLGGWAMRLKQGNLYVFGRGGEDLQALRAQGIAFELMPGLTGASGCSAASGIPLTHRNLASRYVFLPGHFAQNDATYDWRTQARPGQTRVLYLGVQRLAQIAERLFSQGLALGIPAAIVRDGARITQMEIACGLRRLAQMAPAYGPQPGLLIIGETVRMSPQYYAD